MKTKNKFSVCLYFAILFFVGWLGATSAHADLNDEPKTETSINTSPLVPHPRLETSTFGPGQNTNLIIDAELAKGHHAYKDQFKLVIDSPDDVHIGALDISPVVKFNDIVTHTEREGIEDHATIRTPIETPSGFKPGSYILKFHLTYQACTADHCLFPKSVPLELPFTISTGATTGAPAAGATADVPPPQTDSFDSKLSGNLLVALGLIFGMGFLTSLTPCIYPMIPITLAVLGAREMGQTRMRGFILSVFYVLGIATTYSVLGVIAARTGALFGSALSNVYVVTAIALVFCAMGFSMYGFYEIQVPAFIRDRFGGGNSGGGGKSKTGIGGAFGTGLLAGVVASPCVGPVLVSILAFIARSQNWVLGMLYLFTFALGLGVLFIVLGTFSSLAMRVPKAGRWMETVKFIFGSLMLIMALYYVYPLYPHWLTHALAGVAIAGVAAAHGAFNKGALKAQVGLALGILLALAGAAEGVRAGPEKHFSDGLSWQPYSDAIVAQAAQEHRPVIIDFDADWCAACKELEHLTFTDSHVHDISQKFTMAKMNATQESDLLSKLRDRYKVMGLPTIILIDSKGMVREDLRLTGFENAELFAKRMESAL